MTLKVSYSSGESWVPNNGNVHRRFCQAPAGVEVSVVPSALAEYNAMSCDSANLTLRLMVCSCVAGVYAAYQVCSQFATQHAAATAGYEMLRLHHRLEDLLVASKLPQAGCSTSDRY